MLLYKSFPKSLVGSYQVLARLYTSLHQLNTSITFMSDSETGSVFADNTVFYDSKVLTSSIELVSSKTKINAGQKVPQVFGHHQVIAYPRIPSEGKTLNFVATSYTSWAPGETVTVTGEPISRPRTWHCLPSSKGPFGDNTQTLQLSGTSTSGIVIFEEAVDN